MASVRQDNVQVNVEINGEKAGQTLSELKSETAQLYREISKLAPGTQAFADKAAQIQKVETKLSDAKKQIKGITEETGKASRAYGMFGVNVEDVTGKMDDFAQGSSLAARAVGFINNAFKLLLANPIVLVFTLLVAAFIKLASATDFVKDKFDQLFGGLTAVFDFLVNSVSTLLTSGNAFTSFGDIVSGVFEFIKNRIKDYLTVFAGIGEAVWNLLTLDWEGAKAAAQKSIGAINNTIEDSKKAAMAAAEGFGELAGKMKDAFNAGVAYKQTLQEIEDAENALRLERAQADRQVSMAMIQIKNKTLAEKEKLALLDAAGAKEKAIADQELALAATRLEAVRKRNQAIAAGGSLQDAQVEELQEAQVAYENAAKNTENTLEKIQNRRDALLEQEAAKRKAAADKAFAIEQANAARRATLIEEELSRSLAVFEVEAAGRRRTAEQNGEDLVLLEKVLAGEKIKITHEYEEKKKKADEAAAKEAKLKHERELAAEEALLKRKSELHAKAALAYADLEILKSSGNDRRLLAAMQNRLAVEKDIKLQALEDQKNAELAKANGNAELIKEIEDNYFAERVLATAQFEAKKDELRDNYANKEKERQRAILQSAVDLTMTGLSAISDFAQINAEKQLREADRVSKYKIDKLDAELKNKRISEDQYQNAKLAAEAEAEAKIRKIKRRQAEQDKKAQIAQALINGALAVTNILATRPKFDLGVGDALMIAATGVATAAAVARIAATPIPEFARGGMFGSRKYSHGGVPDGPLHNQGGISMINSLTGEKVGEMEGGEPYMILSRNTYSNNREVIDRLLDSSLHRGGAKIYQDGGVTGRLPQNATAGSSESNALMIGLLSSIDAKISAWPGQLRAYVVASELSEMQELLDGIEKDSGF